MAGDLQPGYSAVRDTISSLAAYGMPDRWVMTAGLYLLGVCDVVTALGLRAAPALGRWLLAAGGLCAAVVAAAPQPVHGLSSAHAAATSIGCIVLTVWVWPRDPRPGLLAPRPAVGSMAVVAVLLAWLAAELLGAGDGRLLGLSERLLTTAQAVLPLAVVLSLRVGQPRGRRVEAAG